MKYIKSIIRSLTHRCGYCGKRFKLIYTPVEIGEKFYHWGHCANVVAVFAKKAQLEVAPPETLVERKQEYQYGMYYGCYSWWREAVLLEPPGLARARAYAHVQRSVYPCDVCRGEGNIIYAGFDASGNPVTLDSDRNLITWLSKDCESCDGTGHQPVEDPIPAELIP